MRAGRYTLLELAAEGGGVETWMARDERLSRVVTIRRLRVDGAVLDVFVCDEGWYHLVLEHADGVPRSSVAALLDQEGDTVQARPGALARRAVPAGKLLPSESTRVATPRSREAVPHFIEEQPETTYVESRPPVEDPPTMTAPTLVRPTARPPVRAAGPTLPRPFAVVAPPPPEPRPRSMARALLVAAAATVTVIAVGLALRLPLQLAAAPAPTLPASANAYATPAPPRPARLQVHARGPVYVDGRLIGVAPLRYELPPGPHRLGITGRSSQLDLVAQAGSQILVGATIK